MSNDRFWPVSATRHRDSLSEPRCESGQSCAPRNGLRTPNIASRLEEERLGDRAKKKRCADTEKRFGLPLPSRQSHAFILEFARNVIRTSIQHDASRSEDNEAGNGGLSCSGASGNKDQKEGEKSEEHRNGSSSLVVRHELRAFITRRVSKHTQHR